MFQNRKEYQTQQQPQSESAKTLLEPQTVEINGYSFIISKMPCTVAQEVIFNLPTGFIPLMQNFKLSEEQAFKMLSYCERVYSDGRANVPLASRVIIDNHVPDFDTLIKLEYACLQYNYDFFKDGRALNFLNKGLSLAESKATGILTDLLDKLFPPGVQPFGNSKMSTH